MIESYTRFLFQFFASIDADGGAGSGAWNIL